jgi:voltage-dependent calcium channel T type alpha-1G
VLKVLAFGIWKGRRAYFRSHWNKLDFILLVTAWLNILLAASLNSGSAVKVLAALQAMRALRPLRIVHRVPLLRETVEALVLSLKSLLHTLFIGGLILFIFAGLGVRLFKGGFHFCDFHHQDSNSTMCHDNSSMWLGVETESDCILQGGKWRNSAKNFDNMLEACASLFLIAAKDGWVDVLNLAIDARGEGITMVRNHNPVVALYFISFLLAIAYFVLNLFIGVIVENYQRAVPIAPGEAVERDIIEKTWSRASVSGRSHRRSSKPSPFEHYRSAREAPHSLSRDSQPSYSLQHAGVLRKSTHTFGPSQQ